MWKNLPGHYINKAVYAECWANRTSGQLIDHAALVRRRRLYNERLAASAAAAELDASATAQPVVANTSDGEVEQHLADSGDDAQCSLADGQTNLATNSDNVCDHDHASQSVGSLAFDHSDTCLPIITDTPGITTDHDIVCEEGEIQSPQSCPTQPQIESFVVEGQEPVASPQPDTDHAGFGIGKPDTLNSQPSAGPEPGLLSDAMPEGYHRDVMCALKRLEGMMSSIMANPKNSLPGDEGQRQCHIDKVVQEFPTLKANVQNLQRQIPEIQARIPDRSVLTTLENEFLWLSTKDGGKVVHWASVIHVHASRTSLLLSGG